MARHGRRERKRDEITMGRNRWSTYRSLLHATRKIQRSGSNLKFISPIARSRPQRTTLPEITSLQFASRARRDYFQSGRKWKFEPRNPTAGNGDLETIEHRFYSRNAARLPDLSAHECSNALKSALPGRYIDTASFISQKKGQENSIEIRLEASVAVWTPHFKTQPLERFGSCYKSVQINLLLPYKVHNSSNKRRILIGDRFRATC